MFGLASAGVGTTSVRLALIAVVLLSACAGGADDDGVGDGGPGDGATITPAAGADLVAQLGGDANLEGGCAWLVPVEGEPAPTPPDRRYEAHWPDGYAVEFDPVRLIGPDGEVMAEEGDVVQVRGSVARDVMTTCQVGPVFDVTEVLAP